jgi:hypothetical protein
MFKKLLIVSLAVMFFGCSILSGMDPQSLKTPHARANFINVTYTLAFADYQRFASMPNLNPQAKVLLNAKRAILARLYIPVSLFNGHAETGTITDAMFNELLNKLMDLEQNWYTQSMAVTDGDVRKMAVEAGLIGETSAQMDPIFIGVLLELLRNGIHAYRAIQQQKHLDAIQMEAAWRDSLAKFQALDVNGLIVIQ